MKRFLSLMLCLLFLGTLLTACNSDGGEAGTTADDGSGTTAPTETEAPAVSGTDDPGASPEPMLEIIKPDNTTTYTVLRSETASGTVISAASALHKAISATGAKPRINTDWEKEPVSEYEIIVGQTTRENKDFYIADRALLGNGGYIVKVIGKKILITGGSDDSTAEAVRYFTGLITSGGFSLPADYEYTHSPAAVLDGIEYGDVSLGTFGISVPEGDALCAKAAETLRREIFACSGIVLPQANEASESGHTVFITRSQENTFSFKANGGNIYISGSVRTGISRGIRTLLGLILSEAAGTLKVKDGDKYSYDCGTVVCYEDFGAVGDGKTDDAAALRDAHNYANKNNLPVLAREDATYYIGGADCRINIGTDTNWSCASFIIDDTKVADRGREVFLIQYTQELITLTDKVSSLKAGQTNIGVTLPADCIVTAQDSNVKQYIRYGSNQDNGSAQTDVFRVFKDGTVDPETPILWDYNKVTSLTARPIDQKKLTLSGGIITTIANADTSGGYYYRGIRIYRSNVHIDGLTHYITGEGAVGSPYYGILIFNGSVDSDVTNCTFTPHKTYKKIGSAGTTVSMGTYELTVTNSLNVNVVNCTQTIDICDTAYWGVFASNYSKNLVFDSCSFSRFDAHKGVRNVTIRNCSLGHQGINLIGSGTALIEGTTVYSKTFVNLRSDYGSTWNGDLIIRDCIFIPNNGAKCDAVIIGGSNTGTHDFGYKCYLPRNIVIENLTIDDSKPSTGTGPQLFANIDKNFTSDKYTAAFPIAMTEKVTVSGLVTKSGKALVASTNKYMFKDLVIEIK